MRRSHRVLLVLCLIQLGATGAVHVLHAPPDWSSPELARTFLSTAVKEHGQLSVQGTQLVDSRGVPVTLRGISLHGLQWFPTVRGWTIPAMVRMFGVELVRLPVVVESHNPDDRRDYWGGYAVDPDTGLRLVRAAIEDALDAGVYAIVDWHLQGDPALYADQAADFFETISREYGEHPNIIYEIANEPTGVDWPEIKQYAEQIIPIIRNNDPDGVILVGTPDHSSGAHYAAAAPLAHEGVMYVVHFYAGTHDLVEFTENIDEALSAGAPVFISEWGATDTDVTFTRFDIAEQWVEAMESRQLSWTNWSLSNKAEPASVLVPRAPMSGPWEADELTESGRWLQPHLVP
jgi:endoglucanase